MKGAVRSGETDAVSTAVSRTSEERRSPSTGADGGFHAVFDSVHSVEG